MGETRKSLKNFGSIKRYQYYLLARGDMSKTANTRVVQYDGPLYGKKGLIPGEHGLVVVYRVKGGALIKFRRFRVRDDEEVFLRRTTLKEVRKFIPRL